MMLVSKGSYPKKLQTGEYDDKILCAECDNAFSSWEQYTANLLVRNGAYDRFRQARLNFYTVQSYEYASLKLCLLSILWKMSVSKRDTFRAVNLGPFEAAIRQMLLDNNPGRADEFPISICRIVGKFDSNTLRRTVPIKVEGVNFYQLGLPGYVAFIKVDKRPMPRRIGKLAPKTPLVIGIARSSFDLNKIAGLVNQPDRRKTWVNSRHREL
jgi:hypothetical protein